MSNKAATLWMGDLETYMDENFIKQAFTTMGESAIYVKIMRNRYTGQPFGYGFVEFESEDVALRVLHRVNGKLVPSSSPPKRFKLNHANHGHPFNKEFSLFVGDLTPEVDDLALYKAFSIWYPSCKVARVVLDATGRSRGYGFVRFTEEYEQQQALQQMQNYTGLGGKPIRVSLATPKTPQATTTPGTTPTMDYSQYYQTGYDQYQGYYQNWSDYSQYYAAYNYGAYAQTDPTQQAATTPTYDTASYDAADSVEEYDTSFDVEQSNVEFMERCEEVFDALDASRWLPPETYDNAAATVVEVQ